MSEFKEDELELSNNLMLATDKVPWSRYGNPSYPTGKDDFRWDYRVLNKSVKSNRLYTDRQMVEEFRSAHIGLLERSFAQMWDYENNGAYHSTIYDMFLTELAEGGIVKSDHDEVVMAHAFQCFVQWLGTNCGQGFLWSVQNFAKDEENRITEMIYPGRAEKERKNHEKWEKERKQSEEEDREREIDEEVEKRLEKRMKEIVDKRVSEGLAKAMPSLLREIENKVLDDRINDALPEAVEREIKRRNEIARKKVNPARQIVL
jgi:Asp-tRNA(Asn)/Glu-tRNA(Gln) amidotransferase A subunit family amidase